jgi:replicative DNA helicase
VRHEYLWDAMTRLNKRGDTLDTITLAHELKAMGRLADVGGEAYLTSLMVNTPTSANAEVYGRLVYRTALRRRLIVCGDDLRKLALDQESSMEDVMADAERAFTNVRDASLEDGGLTFKDMVGQFMDDVFERVEHPDRPIGIPSGWNGLDDLLGGWHKGDLVIVAGRPGMGKTSAMLTAALNAAKLGARVGIASQEMTHPQVVARMAAIETGINLQKINHGRLDAEEVRRFVKAAGVLSELPIHVIDAPGLTPAKLRMQALRWMRRGGLDLLMVDYLQIMSSGGIFRGNERVQEVGYFARSLKQLAKELRIPVIAAAQLSRGVENREDKRPILSDLRESGEIEQEADVVAFLYRDVVYNEATEFPNRADVIVAKHRNGPTGVVSLHFEKHTTRFTDARVQHVDLRVL